MMKLERLRIDKFRNVKPGSEIRFADGFNIVLGRNGTGKTTLLELISCIVRWNFDGLEQEEFAIAYELVFDGWRISVEIANRKDVAQLIAPFIAPMFSSHAERMLVAMTARVQRGSDEAEFVVLDGDLQASQGTVMQVRPIGTPTDAIFSLGMTLGADSKFPFTDGRLDKRRFDESLDLFRLTWGTTSFPGKLLTFSDDALQQIHTFDEVLRLFIEHYRAEPTHNSFSAKGQKLKFLDTTTRIMGFESSELQIDVLGRTGSHVMGTVDLGNLIARFFFPDGGFITQDRLSYGQKRLLMFYYYLASNPDIVIADELVNGLHHQWITACIDEIGERQAFLTSQNPLLLDYLPFSSAEHVRKSFVLCTSELDENKKPVWSWSNMSEEAAKEFYSAYQVGVEHVSEILQSQGLF